MLRLIMNDYLQEESVPPGTDSISTIRLGPVRKKSSWPGSSFSSKTEDGMSPIIS